MVISGKLLEVFNKKGKEVTINIQNPDPIYKPLIEKLVEKEEKKKEKKEG